ncbi:MAG: VWA domain-containing protein, partial [Eudoraea sp.]|nr:VWA domain-containing protein [Eudoraea sp.]
NTDSKKINTQIEATSVGFKSLEFRLEPLKGERNTQNNTQLESIEVIDEKTNIGIVTSVMHPDIGALIKTIESNEQRSATILEPTAPETELAEIDLFILYQPTQEFAPVYRYINEFDRNTFTITGLKTDWRFLNRVQNSLERTNYLQTEEIFPVLNAGFGLFDVAKFSVVDFPPLEGSLGELIVTRSSENILEQRIKGVETNEPLLAVMYDDARREAFLFGENLWRWRVQSFRNDKNFDNFDELFSKLFLYLASSEKRERLTVDYELSNLGASSQRIIATYFDNTYAFDSKAELNVAIRNSDTGTSLNLPMELKNNFYETDISDLPSGTYSFTVSVSNENISKSGGFTISDFSLEQQFLRSDVEKLKRLADGTSGKLVYPDNVQIFIEDLMNNSQYIPIQKSVQNVVSLIDFKTILAIIISALTAEWFIRKYNGLI